MLLYSVHKVKIKFNKDLDKKNFDSRNYGFIKLTPLIKSIGEFEIEQRENPKSKHKLIFVKNKEKRRYRNKK